MDEDDLLRRPTGSSNYGPAGLQNIRRNFPQRGRARSQSLNPKRFAGQLAANEIQNRTPRNRASHFKEPKPKQLFLRECRNHNISEQMGSTNMTTSKNRQDRAQRDDNKIRRMGFLTLEALVKSDVKDILANLNAKKEGFLNLLQSPIDRADVHVLIMELLSKICESSFHQLKLTVLLDVCNSQFIGNFKNYLLDLPYVENKSANNKYWKNEIEFWKNFIMFCESIIVMSPTTALTKCRSLIDGSSKCCLEGLRDRHNFTLPEEYSMKLIQLRESLTAHEKDKTAKEERKLVVGKEEQEPPENFRDLSVVPCREDLIEDRPYLRENLISGSYRNVEHYLDVQFRLLREDCFGPLRGGILQFMRDPTKMKYDNIRVYHNVKFVESYISPQKIGSVVEVDDNTKKRFKKMNWSYSKRFIYGTLLLFTKDKCNTFIVATTIEQNIKYLENGKIPVSIFHQFDVGDNLYGNQKYTMFESEVYFEPYYHILRALQDPTFPEHLAMKKYVVDVDPEPAHPAYLQVDKTYNVKISFSKRIKFNVLDYNTWPSSDDLGFNQSQYEAYKTALTREFALIQGPPGTGKTFLGIKIAQTLLTNINKPGCVLLLVCFTNHALDQFLEGLIPVTDSIVRIGGQSRNEALQQFNLSQLRNKSRNGLSNAHRLFRKQKNELESNILELKAAQYEIDFINESIISYTSMAKYVPECSHLEELYKTTLKSGKDPLSLWLFENLVYDFKEPITKEGQAEDFLNTEFMENRNQVILDDFEVDSNMLSNSNIKKAFSLKIAKSQLIYSIQQYLNTDLNCALKRNLHFHIVALRAKIKRFTEMKSYDLLGIRTTPVDLRNLRNLPMVDRWLLYFRWTKIITDKLKEDIRPLQESVLNSNTAYEESRTLLDVELLQKVKVIGMTTSGAARLRKLITVLASPVVIVEEAAEVLEQHIVTSLTKSCEHLILIGDHQQLRPSAANLRLAKHYSLEVSLFERMILNGVHSRRLSVQHRMRPRISALIVPHIYTELHDHPSVAHFPDVRGLTDNVFFFTHGYHEEVVEDSSSKTNKEEADLILGFANYIMQQGYQPQDVTILAAYSGQMFYLRKQRPLYAHLSKVKITVLDNYQGEESKIILLSLVRSNEQKNIGFLGSKNRICLALSRAKEGFYIFGNIDILKENSNLWTKIAETLENQGSLGTSIRLKCQNHPDQITTISSVKDFSKVPEGGCLLKCNYNLPCLHACPLVCHGYDPGHATIICPFQCERIICELDHVCPLMCREKCEPCKQKITKTLPCGHDMEIFCYLKPQDPSIKCLTTVSVILPECGHEVKKSCYMETRDVACPLPCGLRVQRCGHTCVRTCHVGDDPDHEVYICSKPCVKAKKGCTMDLEEGDRGDHQCRKQCYETCDDCNIKVLKKRSSCKHREHIACSKNVDETPCGKKCARTLPCGHFCMKKCFENCGDCKIKVKKVIPECGHEAEMACGARAARAQCGRPCERRLRCGHACRQRCRDACDAALCAELVPRHFDSPCGHRVQLPCNIYSAENGFPSHETLLKHCRAVCGAELVCEHICAGNCASCLHGRLHQPCKQLCKQMNICGHECEEPCNEVCPPCNKVCEMKCVHARCPLPCGSPCVSCKEQCTRACEHGRCSQLCGEQCSRAGCSRPCPLQLACGHACRGLCGERCPDICKICRPDDFPSDFLGDEFDDEALFVVLEDCGHIMEFEYMEHLMNLESEPITLHACSLCRKPIINTPRYKDLVNKRMKTDINPIKERVYGNVQKNLDTKNRLLQEILKFQTAHKNLLSDILYSDLKNAFIELKHFVLKYKKNNSLLQLNMHFLYLNILEMMANICKKFKTAKLTELQDDLVKNISLISGFMRGNVRKISQQQQMDIRNEIKRLDSIIQLSKLLSSQNYKISCVSDPKVNEAMEAAKEMVLGIGIYKEDNAINALKLFEDVIKASGIVTKTERDMIVRAIGAKAGQWYKCRNGHFYSINQCGGAMVVGKCIECKAPIGGTNHRLLEDNKHAPEIDNSKFPAWSEEANNMANFDFDDLW
ncbi:NFX1-type zinc finger-containing protein 1-like [Vanessa cardui]|uniref:NFX1-type zinc finger-containing protein 1-like n=1 Tax=Vanessa cardui TaxID=171605 RepID=UPI001F141B16|nr:NFX1-type zinc finger-containing protein 1-like [Vanessa cardui]XP_046965729.1 NFX1-type zinc finger-containing protein 1-like [Vanessa cardui]XP_046965730.1 NFX1-type zinc finger-containing protein 1-like [Vanessa cardui]XP_046965731.1 NFX1-type zinc finger-containing protein 1-like [Vanessa cardui]